MATATSSSPLQEPVAPGGDIAPMDWQGAPIDCQACAFKHLLGEGRCELGRACVQDCYARRIDRFMRWNPELSNGLLDHPYFEVRAIAARHADVFRLPDLIEDPDETVRMQLALRLPQRQLMRLCHDPHREVRIRVAQRLDTANLSSMIKDPDYYVRQVVARRLPVALLPLLAHDPESEVRQEVAQRLEMPALLRLVDDPAPGVRRVVAERLPTPLLGKLALDPDLLVRWEVAQRAQPDVLVLMLKDADDEVRVAARQRLMPGDDDTPLGETHGRHQPR